MGRVYRRLTIDSNDHPVLLDRNGRAVGGPATPSETSASPRTPVADVIDLDKMLYDPGLRELLLKFLLPHSGGIRLLASEWNREKSGEPGKSVGHGDAFGLAGLCFMLGALFSDMNRRDAQDGQERAEHRNHGPKIQSGSLGSADGPDPWSGCNVICVGGPVSNEATGKILGASPGLPFHFDRHHLHVTVDGGERTYDPPYEVDYSGGTYPRCDYGVMVRLPSPFAPDRTVWMFAGRRTFGTYAVVDVFSRAHLVTSLMNAAAENPFIALVEGVWTHYSSWPDSVKLPVVLVRDDGNWLQVPFSCECPPEDG